MRKKVAVITGANRGIGFGTAKALAERDYTVVVVGRDADKIRAAAEKLRALGLDVEAAVADVADTDTVRAMAAELTKRHPAIDVLVNNAGVILETDVRGAPSETATVDPAAVLATLNINTVGALRMSQALLPALKKSPAGRIVNISSGMGALNDMDGGWPAYRLSKAALNALTRVLAAETANSHIKVNAVCPGWVRTDMGGTNASRSVEDAVPGILWAAELDDNGPHGGFFRDGKPIAW